MGTNLQAIAFTFAGGSVVGVTCLILFSVAVRNRDPNIAPRCTARPKDTIYAHRRRHKCQQRGGPMLGWVWWTLRLSYDTMLRGIPGTGTRNGGMEGKMLDVNLDGIVMLRFHAVCLKVCFVTTLLALGVILPVNLTAQCYSSNDLDPSCTDPNDENVQLTNYERTTIANIPPITSTDSASISQHTDLFKVLRGAVWSGHPYTFLLMRMYIIVLCSWIVYWYACLALKNEWKEALALRRVYYLENNLWERRRDEYDETIYLAEDATDCDYLSSSSDESESSDCDVEIGVEMRNSDGKTSSRTTLQERRRSSKEGNGKKKNKKKNKKGKGRNERKREQKKRQSIYEKQQRDPWIPHAEQRETVPSIELYSVLVGDLPCLPSEVVSENDIETSIGFSRAQAIDWQLAVVSTFFNHCVPNQPGFSSSVAAVTILPAAPDLARAWRRWYTAAAALRRLKFIRTLIAKLRHYDIPDYGSDDEEEYVDFDHSKDSTTNTTNSSATGNKLPKLTMNKLASTSPTETEPSVTANAHNAPSNRHSSGHNRDVSSAMSEWWRKNESTETATKFMGTMESKGRSRLTVDTNINRIDVLPEWRETPKAGVGNGGISQLTPATAGQSIMQPSAANPDESESYSAEPKTLGLSPGERARQALTYYREVFGSDDNLEVERQFFQALNYGPEQTAVYSRELAMGAASCCPNGCGEQRLRRNAKIDELIQMEREAVVKVHNANMALQYAQARAAVSVLDNPTINGVKTKTFPGEGLDTKSSESKQDEVFVVGDDLTSNHTQDKKALAKPGAAKRIKTHGSVGTPIVHKDSKDHRRVQTWSPNVLNLTEVDVKGKTKFHKSNTLTITAEEIVLPESLEMEATLLAKFSQRPSVGGSNLKEGTPTMGNLRKTGSETNQSGKSHPLLVPPPPPPRCASLPRSSQLAQTASSMLGTKVTLSKQPSPMPSTDATLPIPSSFSLSSRDSNIMTMQNQTSSSSPNANYSNLKLTATASTVDTGHVSGHQLFPHESLIGKQPLHRLETAHKFPYVAFNSNKNTNKMTSPYPPMPPNYHQSQGIPSPLPVDNYPHEATINGKPLNNISPMTATTHEDFGRRFMPNRFRTFTNESNTSAGSATVQTTSSQSYRWRDSIALNSEGQFTAPTRSASARGVVDNMQRSDVMQRTFSNVTDAMMLEQDSATNSLHNNNSKNPDGFNSSNDAQKQPSASAPITPPAYNWANARQSSVRRRAKRSSNSISDSLSLEPSEQWRQVERICQSETDTVVTSERTTEENPKLEKSSSMRMDKEKQKFDDGVWEVPTANSISKSMCEVICHLTAKFLTSCRSCARRKTNKMVDELKSDSSFAVVTFTNRQAAVAARHCLADGRGKNRWVAVEQHPVAPLADAASFDFITCRGCCRPVTLNINKKQQMMRRWVRYIILAVLYVFYTLPISLATSLVKPETLFEIFPKLEELTKANPIFSRLLSGLVPGSLFVLFFALCPQIFKAISNFGSNAKSVMDAESQALKDYWWFMVFTAFSGSSIMQMVLSMINLESKGVSIGELLVEIAQTIPTQVSATWINWMILRVTCILPNQYLLQLNSFIFEYLGMPCCRRAVMGGGPGGVIPYRIYVDSGVVFMCAVALSFPSPIVAPCSLIYFLVCAPLWRRNCIYIYRPKFDGGGLRWPFLFDVCITSMVVGQLLLCTIMVLKEAIGPAIMSAFPVLPTLLYRSMCRNQFLKAYEDAGLLQTSLLDGWDNTVPHCMVEREEFRRFLVDTHKAAYIPVCIAGDATSVLTAEPAITVPIENDDAMTGIDDEFGYAEADKFIVPPAPRHRSPHSQQGPSVNMR